ncbi:MAG: DUF3793 family protein, partial [Candidatus Moranbacteria bacterium]|nr:DUF3793 family protein [Candidatus Moranbacteria bacterium]
CMHNSQAECGRNYFDLWELYRLHIVNVLDVSFIEMHVMEQKKQVLFFKETLLKKQLTVPAHRTFLAEHGYDESYDLKECLEVLRKRYRNKNFPHEIGIFLGYPLKDVRGFVERKEVAMPHTGRWRIYGNAELSLRLMTLYAKAEEIFSRMIEEKENVSVQFVNTIKGSFQLALSGCVA